MHISVITPVYGCKTCLESLQERLENILPQISQDYEIIMVDDCSPDGAWQTIELLSTVSKKVKGVKLSRNFGQHYAIMAGLSKASGEWVVVMDCDLQDQPEEILRLYAHAQKGYDIVLGRRENRQDSFLKKSFSKLFYQLLSYMTDTKQDYTVANFGVYNKKVVQAVLSMNDKFKYFPTMVRWVGFRLDYLAIAHAPRTEGKSSYNFSRLFDLATNIILSFSDKPLRLVMKLGLGISSLAFLFSFYVIYLYFSHKVSMTGWSSIIFSIWFLSGIIIFVMGLVALYISKIFENVKDRPVFIIDKMTNL